MKSLFLLILGLISLMSCQPSTPNKGDSSQSYGDFKLRVIDSCEYLEYDHTLGVDGQYSLTHKGNCKFCKKRNERIWKNLIHQH